MNKEIEELNNLREELDAKDSELRFSNGMLSIVFILFVFIAAALLAFNIQENNAGMSVLWVILLAININSLRRHLPKWVNG